VLLLLDTAQSIKHFGPDVQTQQLTPFAFATYLVSRIFRAEAACRYSLRVSSKPAQINRFDTVAVLVSGTNQFNRLWLTFKARI